MRPAGLCAAARRSAAFRNEITVTQCLPASSYQSLNGRAVSYRLLKACTSSVSTRSYIRILLLVALRCRSEFSFAAAQRRVSRGPDETTRALHRTELSRVCDLVAAVSRAALCHIACCDVR